MTTAVHVSYVENRFNEGEFDMACTERVSRTLAYVSRRAVGTSFAKWSSSGLGGSHAASQIQSLVPRQCFAARGSYMRSHATAARS